MSIATDRVPEPRNALVIGEALIDIVVAADEPAVEIVGGGPLNIAIGLSRLGHPSELLAHIAHDERGERIARHLAADGAELHPGSWGAPRTPTAQATIDEATGAASYVFDIAWDLPPLERVTAPLVHLGSIGLFLEPGGEAEMRLLEDLPADTLVTVDPNVRASLIDSHDDAVRRFEAAAARANLVKLSDEDAAWLYPDLAFSEAAAKIRALGPRIVILTRGVDGAYGVSERGAIEAAAHRVEVVDTISAGDSFMASLVASLLERGVDGCIENLESVLDRAARAAAIAVSAAGANPPYREQLDRA